jgi:hypothetical protein
MYFDDDDTPPVTHWSNQASPGASAATTIISPSSELAQQVSVTAVMTQMHLLQVAAPAVRLCMRSLPDSKEKTNVVQILDTWTDLHREGSVVSPPNLLHLAYVSVVMSRCLARQLRQIVAGQLSAGTSIPINMLIERLSKCLL